MRNSELVSEALRRARSVHRAPLRHKTRMALEVSYATGVSLDQMRQPTRGNKHIVQARWAAMWAMRQAGYSYPAIGAFFNRDHTSVIHAIQKMEGR